jgi:hypothetical protein
LLDVAEARLPKVIAALFDRAEQGDTVAIEIVLRYSLGKPLPAPDPDRLDLDEVRLLFQRPLAEQLLMAAACAVPADLAANWLRLAAAVRGDRALQPDPEEDDDDPAADPDAIARAAALCRLRDQILQARARTT